MKKALVMLLTCALLVGCAGSVQQSTNSTATPMPTATPQVSSLPTPEPTPIPTPAPTLSPVQELVAQEWDTLYACQQSGEVLGWEYTLTDKKKIDKILALIAKAETVSEYQGNPDGGYPIEIYHAKGEEKVLCLQRHGGANTKINGVNYDMPKEDYDEIEKIIRGY